MVELDPKYLDTFPAWLGSLGQDAQRLGALLERSGLTDGAREAIIGGLNYLFRSLDLIPDGIDDIGYLDDAFVLRVAADLAATNDDSNDPEASSVLSSLAAECDVVRDFLGKDYVRLETYVKGLRKGAARGRSVGDVLGDEAIRKEFLGDVTGFAEGYQAPAFTREDKTLIKLFAFLDAKLPKS